MTATTRTLIIRNRGRKYFDCISGGHRAQLIINEVSAGLQTGCLVTVEVWDHTVRTKFGSTVRFEPIAILHNQAGSELPGAIRTLALAEKWLGFAESDARQGLYKTNAIGQAIQLVQGYTHLEHRLEALRTRINHNRTEVPTGRSQSIARQTAGRRRLRVLYPVSMLPQLGVPVRMRSRAIVFVSYGQRFRIHEGHPTTEGSHLFGHEFEWGCYCYYRTATADEISILPAS